MNVKLGFVMAGIFCCMNLYASHMSTSSSLNTSSSMASLSAAILGATQEKRAKDEQQEMKELEALYEKVVKEQEQEEELKEESEKAAPIIVAAVKKMIANIDAVNPESEEEVHKIDAEIDDSIKQFQDPEAQKELAEWLKPSLDRMHQRLASYTPLRNRWELLLKQSKENEHDEGFQTEVEQLRKETEAIGYYDVAQARALEILHPTRHRIEMNLAAATNTLADWVQSLWRFTPSVA